MKVLVADDSDIMRRRLFYMIEAIGGVKRVCEAGDYTGTMQQLSQYRPDILVLDIRMPGGTGIDVLKSLETKKETGKRPSLIIVYTNYSYPQYFEECYRLGADYCFDKSTDIENLVDVIRSHSFLPEGAGVSQNTNR